MRACIKEDSMLSANNVIKPFSESTISRSLATRCLLRLSESMSDILNIRHPFRVQFLLLFCKNRC